MSLDLVVGRCPSFHLICRNGGTIGGQEGVGFLPTPPEPSNCECQPICDENRPLHQNKGVFGVFGMVPRSFDGMKQLLTIHALTEFDGQLTAATGKENIELLTFLDGCQCAFRTGLLRFLRSSDPINCVNDAISGCSSGVGPVPQCLPVGSACLIRET